MLHAITILITLTASTLDATPLIHEVFYDATGPDAHSVFTELIGDPGFVLDGWTLVGVNGSTGTPYRTIPLAGVFPPSGLFVISAASANAELRAVSQWTANVDWQNGPDAIQLLDPSGLIVDALQYGDAGGFNAGEGRPAEDVAAGIALTRSGRDTDDNAADFRSAAPTPGRVASKASSPPTAALMALAALALSQTSSRPGRRRLRRGREPHG